MDESRRDKWYKAIIRTYGSIEAWREQNKVWTSKGGKNSSSRPFRDNNGLAKEAGRKGGLAKKRKSDEAKDQNN